MNTLGPPEFVEAKPDKREKPWQHHLSVGLKIFFILFGIAVLFLVLDAPCIVLAFHGTRC